MFDNVAGRVRLVPFPSFRLVPFRSFRSVGTDFSPVEVEGSLVGRQSRLHATRFEVVIILFELLNGNIKIVEEKVES